VVGGEGTVVSMTEGLGAITGGDGVVAMSEDGVCRENDGGDGASGLNRYYDFVIFGTRGVVTRGYSVK
jgi:hypothetical protein